MKKNTNTLLFISSFLIVLNSCTVTKHSVSGVYIFIDKNNNELSEAVHLNEDGTFNFQISATMSPYPRLKGNWELAGRNVILRASNISIMDGDTLKFRNWNYKISWGNLKRQTRGTQHYRTLKKVKTHFKTFILDYEQF